ncbi:hypothetical protein GCK32_003199, partial [Trichostrongylus colubriformis]
GGTMARALPVANTSWISQHFCDYVRFAIN